MREMTTIQFICTIELDLHNDSIDYEYLAKDIENYLETVGDTAKLLEWEVTIGQGDEYL
jgi:hypothetical protein